MKIPKTYTQFGQIIHIKIDSEYLAKEDCNGLAEPDKNLITLADENEEHKLDKEEIERNLIHEMFHIALAKAGYSGAFSDEKFAHTMGNLLYEALKSGKIIR